MTMVQEEVRSQISMFKFKTKRDANFEELKKKEEEMKHE
jgi:hypothetical protein